MTVIINGSGTANGISYFSSPTTFGGTLATASRGISNASVPAGCILQVVQSQFTGNISTSSSSFVDVTGFTGTITPLFSTSKILVQVSTSMYGTSTQGELRVLRSGVDPASITGGRMWSGSWIGASGVTAAHDVKFLDSPATTSAITYQVQIRQRAAATIAIGRDWNSDAGGLHTVIMMEIAQ